MSFLTERSYIRLHTPDGRVQRIFTLHERSSVVDSLPALFENTATPMQLGHGFSLDVGVSNDTHFFVVRERRLRERSGVLIAEVFAVEGLEPLTPNEVFNSALQHYQSDLSGEDEVKNSLTPYHFQQNRIVDGLKYPCGTIFTVASCDTLSNPSSSYSSGNFHNIFSAPQETTPTCKLQSYLHAPAEISSSSHESGPAPTRKGRVLHDEPVIPVLQDEPHKVNLFPSSAGFTGVLVHPRETSEPRREDEISSHEEQNLVSPVPDIKIEVESCSHGDGDEKLGVAPAEETSVNTKSEPSHGLECTEDQELGSNTSPKVVSSSDAAAGSKFGGDRHQHHRLVVGIQPIHRKLSLTTLKPPSTLEAVPRPRSSSYANLQSLQNPEAGPRVPLLQRSISGPPISPTVTPVTDSARPLAEAMPPQPGVPPMEDSGRDSKPPGIQRQESCEDKKNEIVVFNNMKKVICQKAVPKETAPPTYLTHRQQEEEEEDEAPQAPLMFCMPRQQEKPVVQTTSVTDQSIQGLNQSSPNIAVAVSDTDQVQEGSESSRKINFVCPDGSDAENHPTLPAIEVDDVDQGIGPKLAALGLQAPEGCGQSETLGDTGRNLSSFSERGYLSSGSGSSSDGSSYYSSENAGNRYQAHLLGHVYNGGRCLYHHYQEECPYESDAEFEESMRQMCVLREGPLDETMKEYIRIHCRSDCFGKGCKVPHPAAGCLPLTEPCRLPPPREHPSPLPSPDHCLNQTSFDAVAPFDSRTPPGGENGPSPPPRPSQLLPMGQQAIRDTPPGMAVQRHGLATPSANLQTPMRGGLKERHFKDVFSPNMVQSPNYQFSLGRQVVGTEGCDGYYNQHQQAPDDRLAVVPQHGVNQHPNRHHHQQGFPPVASLYQQGIPPATPLHRQELAQQQDVPPATPLAHQQGIPPATPLAHQQGIPPAIPLVHQQGIHPATPFNPHNQGLPTMEQGALERPIPKVQQASTMEDEEGRFVQFEAYGGLNRRLREVIWQGREVKERAGVNLPDVSKEGFPDRCVYRDVKAGTIIYSPPACGCLTVGLTYPLPCMDREKLGKGGNGRVSTHYINGQQYAVKYTNYRSAELSAWKKLSHPNLMPLQGVMMDHYSTGKCFQLMPKMTASLRDELRRVGSLKHQSAAAKLNPDPNSWKTISSNAYYIIECVLCGLVHLESNNMQHHDVKASNILILKTCSCPNIFHCTCAVGSKYEVRLADFDSLQETRDARVAKDMPRGVSCKIRPEAKGVMGTPGYRAPEQFIIPSDRCPPLEKVVLKGNTNRNNDKPLADFDGPWCDTWSFGITLLELCTPNSDTDKCDTKTLLNLPPEKNLAPSNETIQAKLKLEALCMTAFDDHNLVPFVKLANACLQPEFRSRKTAKQLLEDVRAFY